MKKVIWVCGLFLLTACANSEKTAPVAAASTASAKHSIRMELKDPPLVGTTPAGQRVYLGGFSSLRYLGKAAGGKLRFLTNTDRGPNAGKEKNDGDVSRPFLLPGFQPRLVILLADPATGTLTVEKEIPLRRPDGKKLSGLPQKEGQERPIDSQGKPLVYDPYGMDLESVAKAADGSYWTVEEYAPSIARFSADGKLMETLKPGMGLPKVLEQRRMNHGFEGGALLGDRLYAVMQSPLDNPVSEKQKNSKKSNVVRIIEVDIAGRRTLGQYAYLAETRKTARLGDVAVEGARTLLVIEQDGKEGSKSFKKIYRVTMSGATNLQLLPERIAGAGGSLEGMEPEELAAAGVIAVKKEEVMDLTANGVTESKVEGVDIVDDTMLAVATDNDFGMDGSWDKNTGKAGFKAEKPAIYLFPEGSWKKSSL